MDAIWLFSVVLIYLIVNVIQHGNFLVFNRPLISELIFCIYGEKIIKFEMGFSELSASIFEFSVQMCFFI